ncbi:MAG: cytochrome c biogenesis protein CcsA [Anaerolineae bacterium]|nr:cytochrome c biogenesis protein CcsA [Anaerolineae bacterium]MDW8172868.1 cytochrome c-type biogenesis CcmF C-terminal domain-containing protein [Anaerolineae bacterium]
MLAEIGLSALTLAFLASLYAIAASLWGERRQHEAWIISGRNAALATLPLLLVSCGALLVALLTEQYQIRYVWSVTDPQTPLFYRFTALWGSQRGSLLFWCLTMSLFTFGAVWLNWRSDRRLMPYVVAFMMMTLAFFVGLTLLLENPFERWWLDPRTNAEISAALIPEGVVEPPYAALAQTANGLNPLLRHFGMIIHPPMLYLGFVGFVVPFAFALAALASGDLSSNWIKATRRWTLVAWLFLSLGLILGGRWAYDVLGWGGYWGWDPVENAAFLPWLVGTAFLHSVMIQQKRGMLKVWNMALVILTFSAVLFGTFATRSGVIESVHSFARSAIGAPMLTFWASMTILAVCLLLWRWQRGELRDEHAFVGLLSRETLFVLNNVVFVALTAAIFWGSFGAPILSELLFDTSITLGVEYFMAVTPPLFAVLFLLMGVAPLSAWSATSLRRLGAALAWPMAFTAISLLLIALTSPSSGVSLLAYGLVLLAGYVALVEVWRGAVARRRSRGESWARALLALYRRNQRRYGGYMVHLGIVVIGIGVIGSTLFQLETRRTLEAGQTTRIDSEYAMRYDGFQRGLAEDGRVINQAQVTVFRNGTQVAQLTPRIDDFPNMPMTIAGAHSTLEKDFYVLLLGYDPNTQTASFKVYINPLVNLVWWGGLILILGTLLAVWPREAEARSSRKASVGQQSSLGVAEAAS